MPKDNLSVSSKKPSRFVEPEIKETPKAVKVEKKGKINFLEAVDTVMIKQIDQKTVLPSLKSRAAIELLNKDPNIIKKANWKPVFKFAQDLEVDVEQMLEHPQLLNALDSQGIYTLMSTLNKIGEGFVWVEDHRRSKLKDVFSAFMPGYEAEIKAYETSAARMNTAVRGLNPLYQEKLLHEQSQSTTVATTVPIPASAKAALKDMREPAVAKLESAQAKAASTKGKEAAVSSSSLGNSFADSAESSDYDTIVIHDHA